MSDHVTEIHARGPFASRLAPPILLGAALLAVGACRPSRAPSPTAAAASPVPVRVAPVEVRTIPVVGEFIGQTDARDTVAIVPRVTGYLEEIAFREGSHVHRGDVLFRIERANYQAALRAAEARLAQDQAALLKYDRDVARLTPLVKEQAAAQQDLDNAAAGKAQAEAAIRSDQAAVDTARLNLDYTTIRCPIDGIVGRLIVTRGNLVTASQATSLATVSSFDPMYVYFTIPETSYLALGEQFRAAGRGPGAGIPVDLVLADGRGFGTKGAIDFIDRAVDSQTGTIKLRARVPNPQAVLRPGQFARVRFALGQRDRAVLVPKVAITETLNSRSVLLVDDQNRVALRTIVVDGSYESWYIVRSGLSGGERVVVEGTLKARPGSTVAPIAASAKEGD